VSGGPFFCAFGSNLASFAVKIFSNLSYSVKVFCKCCAISVFCKGDAEIKCFSVQHKTVLFLSTLTTHTLFLVAS
jgi:hypothetical protein